MTLREMMTNEIGPYMWLNLEWKMFYKQEQRDGKYLWDSYTHWLNSLSDEDFLMEYNLMHENIATLD